MTPSKGIAFGFILNALTLGLIIILMMRFNPEYKRENIDKISVAGIENKILALTKELERISSACAIVETSPVDLDQHDQREQSAKFAAFEENLNQLELQFEALLKRSPEDDWKNRSEQVKALVHSRLGVEALNSYRSQFLDGGTEPYARIAALEMLNRFPKEMNPIGSEVMDEVLHLLDSSSDPVYQHALMGQVKGSRDERLIKRCISILETSANDNLRGESISVLEDCLDIDYVRAAIERASTLDKSRGVKLRALIALKRFEKD